MNTVYGSCGDNVSIFDDISFECQKVFVFLSNYISRNFLFVGNIHKFTQRKHFFVDNLIAQKKRTSRVDKESRQRDFSCSLEWRKREKISNPNSTIAWENLLQNEYIGLSILDQYTSQAFKSR